MPSKWTGSQDVSTIWKEKPQLRPKNTPSYKGLKGHHYDQATDAYYTYPGTLGNWPLEWTCSYMTLPIFGKNPPLTSDPTCGIIRLSSLPFLDDEHNNV